MRRALSQYLCFVHSCFQVGLIEHCAFSGVIKYNQKAEPFIVAQSLMCATNVVVGL